MSPQWVTISSNIGRDRAEGIYMDPAPPLLFVPELDHEDSIEPLICPVYWNVTTVWLGKPTAKCEVCEARFQVHRGEA
jgi:hypothetical protein